MECRDGHGSFPGEQDWNNQENHVARGNSGVCRVSANESWITCGEGLLRLGKRKGELNKVFHIRITAE
tara:strand:+ start:234 stop:437 length:204 start_codon:yes stop_codon:yes gene_type:complete